MIHYDISKGAMPLRKLNNLLYEIQKNNPIEDVISETIALKPSGNELVGRHHTHESKSGTSFTVNPEKGLYYCFNCGEGGDVITWVRNLYKCNFSEAVSILADRAGIPLDALNGPKFKKYAKIMEERAAVEQVLDIATKFYQAQLTPEIRKYLNKRGIKDETIEKLKIGYAPPGGASLYNHLLETIPQYMFKAGLLVATKDELGIDFFQGRLVFPYLVNNRTVYMIARRTDFTPDVEQERAKYKKLLTHSEKRPYISKTAQNRYLYGIDSLRKGKPVIITEGIIDAILAIQAGYSCISPVTVRFAKRDFPKLLQKTRRQSPVYIINDNEENMAGEKGAEQTAEFLQAHGRQVLLVELPRPEGLDKIDLADFLVTEGKEQLDALLLKAKTLYKLRLEQIKKPDRPELLLPTARDFVVTTLSALGDEFLAEGFIREVLIPHFDLKKADARQLFQVWKESVMPPPAVNGVNSDHGDVVWDEETTDGELTPEEIRTRYFVGNEFSPQLLGQEIMEETPLIVYGNQIHLYQEGVYTADDNRLGRIIQDKLGVLSIKRYRNETDEWLRVQCSGQVAQINKNNSLINLENGLLDVFSGEFKKHTPEFLSTIRIPVEYKPKAKAPLWQKFLSEVVPDDCIPVVWEYIGYCLLPDTRFETNLMLTGSGANGKSVLLKAIATLLGDANMANIPLQELSENRFKRAELAGKLINVFCDLSSRAIQDSAFFKIITSGDPIDGERKFQHPFQFKPFARLLFSANELPATADNTDGFFRRWIIIPFPNTFPPGKRDVRLLGKLTSPEELSGALNLALEGLRRLYKQGRFSVSETINDQLQDYRLRSDPVAAFVAECCVLEKFAIISKAELYNAYRNWTYDTGSKAMSQKRFGPLIRNIEGVDETRDSGTRSWVGIGLKGVKSNLRALK